MNKTFNDLFLLPVDKASHIIYGAIIYSITSFFFNVPMSLVTLLLIAVSKEIRDKITKKGNVELLDIIATMSGCLPLLLHQVF